MEGGVLRVWRVITFFTWALSSEHTTENISFQGMYCSKCILHLAARPDVFKKKKQQNHLLSIAIKTKFTVLTSLYFILHCHTSAYLRNNIPLVVMVQPK